MEVIPSGWLSEWMLFQVPNISIGVDSGCGITGQELRPLGGEPVAAGKQVVDLDPLGR